MFCDTLIYVIVWTNHRHAQWKIHILCI